jgi:putative ABC transport system permease protein
VSITQLAWRNIAGSAFRNFLVFLCVLLVAGLSLSTVLVVRGAENSLQRALDRLGADIIVVPEGTEARVETALLTGNPASVWMPQEKLEEMACLPKVDLVSPQLYLASLANAPCCTAEMFLVAFDPETDFTVTPWLNENLDGELRFGEAIGGNSVFVPYGEEDIRLYGSHIALRGNLEPTGTGLDQTLFLTFETAHDIARHSHTRAVRPLVIPPDSISAVLVKVLPGSDPRVVALQIMHDVPGVTAVPCPDLFRAFRTQITGLLRSMLATLGITALLSLMLIGLVFSMAANERQREIGILRALGATRQAVFQTLLTEAIILALAGGIAGTALASLAIYLFRNLIMASLGGSLLFPSLPSLLALAGGGLALSLAGVTLAALFPALRTSHQEPAVAMKE